MNEKARQLAQRFVDDRDSLSKDELADLVAALRQSPQLAAQLKEQLVLSELLSQRLAVDRQKFAAQVDQRLRDYALGEEELAHQIEDLRELAETEITDWRFQERRKTLIRIGGLLAATIVVCATAGIWFAMQRSVNDIGTVSAVQGKATVVRENQPRDLRPGARVYLGDRLRTARGEMVTIEYPDGTVVHVGAESTVSFPAYRPTQGKFVVVQRGDVTADVKKQNSGQPMIFRTPSAEATVLGTQLTLAVRDGMTWLDVIEGRVRLARRSDADPIVVRENNAGVARAEGLEVRPVRWPVNRDGVVFLFQTNDALNVADEPFSQVRRRCEVEPRGSASFDSDGAMVCQDAVFAARRADSRLLAACRATSELTIQALIRPKNLDPPGPSRVAAFSSGNAGYNFVLGQRRDKLVLRLQTSGENSADEVELCGLSVGEANHVVVSYRPGKLACYLNGDKVTETDEVTGGLEEWIGHHLTFGGAHDGGHTWQGTLEGVAIYSRCIEADEARKNAAEYRELVVERFHNAAD